MPGPVAGCKLDCQQFAAVVDDQMNLKTGKPSRGGFTALGNITEHAMGMNAVRIADFQTSRADEGDTGGFAQMGKQERAERGQGGTNEFHQSATGRQSWKIHAAIRLEAKQVEVFESTKMREVEEHQFCCRVITASPISIAFNHQTTQQLCVLFH